MLRAGGRVASKPRIAAEQTSRTTSAGIRPPRRSRPPSRRPARTAPAGSSPTISLTAPLLETRYAGQQGDEADDDHLHDQVAVGEEAPDAHRDGPSDQAKPRQMDSDREHAGPERHAEEVGAEHLQHSLCPVRKARGQVVGGREADKQPARREPAGVADQHDREPRDNGGRERGTGQGELVPLPGQRPAPPVHPHHADDRERHHAFVEHEHVGDLRPGEREADQHGDPPAGPHPVKNKPDQQQRHLRAEVIGRRQQQVGSRPQRGRQHDHGHDNQADEPLAACRPACRDHARQHHEQHVGQPRGHVHDPAAQPPGELHQQVLGDLGGVERDIRQRPAPQQHVAVQHVPRLQRLGRTLGGRGQRARLGGVGEEQHEHHRRARGHDHPAVALPGPASAARLWRSGPRPDALLPPPWRPRAHLRRDAAMPIHPSSL